VSLRDTLEHLLSGKSLTEAEASELLRALTSAELPPPMAGALLASLRAKGVTADELRGFARAMRSLARQPAIPQAPHAIDSTEAATMICCHWANSGLNGPIRTDTVSDTPAILVATAK